MDNKKIESIVIFFICASVFIVLALNALLSLWKLRRYKGTVIGKVISVKKERTWGGIYAPIYKPTFQYVINDVLYEIESDYYRKYKKYTIGDTEELHYDLENPEKYIEGKEDEWARIIKRQIGGLIFWTLLLGILWWVSRK